MIPNRGWLIGGTAAPAAVAVFSILVAASGCGERNTGARRYSKKRVLLEEFCDEYKEAMPGLPEVTADELVILRRRARVAVVDVREADEHAVSAIPGAMLLEEFNQDRERYEHTPVIVYCTIGYRSGLLTFDLRQEGVDAYNLRGGIIGWVHAGQKVVDEEGETSRVHVYGAEWDFLPDGYQGVW